MPRRPGRARCRRARCCRALCRRDATGHRAHRRAAARTCRRRRPAVATRTGATLRAHYDVLVPIEGASLLRVPTRPPIFERGREFANHEKKKISGGAFILIGPCRATDFYIISGEGGRTPSAGIVAGLQEPSCRPPFSRRCRPRSRWSPTRHSKQVTRAVQGVRSGPACRVACAPPIGLILS